MTYLLDTHVFLWLAAATEKLSSVVRKTVEQGSCELLLSAASGWEIALLWETGADRATGTAKRFCPFRNAGLEHYTSSHWLYHRHRRRHSAAHPPRPL